MLISNRSYSRNSTYGRWIGVARDGIYCYLLDSVHFTVVWMKELTLETVPQYGTGIPTRVKNPDRNWYGNRGYQSNRSGSAPVPIG
jgi:hypothetical protein